MREGENPRGAAKPTNVRYTPESGHRDQPLECPLVAKRRHWRHFRSNRDLAPECLRGVVSCGYFVNVKVR